MPASCIPLLASLRVTSLVTGKLQEGQRDAQEEAEAFMGTLKTKWKPQLEWLSLKCRILAAEPSLPFPAIQVGQCIGQTFPLGKDRTRMHKVYFLFNFMHWFVFIIILVPIAVQYKARAVI